MTEQKTYYAIKYLSILTGMWESYMNHTAWDTRKQTRDEINRLKKAGKKHKLKFSEAEIRVLLETGIRLPTCLTAEKYKIVKVKGHTKP